MRKRTKQPKIQLAILWFLRISTIPVAILAAFDGNWEGFFLALLAFVMMFASTFILIRYSVVVPIEYSLFLALFIYASFILGEFGDAYERFWWWDAVLHGSSAMVFSFLAFLSLYILKLRKETNLSPRMFALFSFCFATMVGTMWEVFEFSGDTLFGLNMQRSGLRDTMGDIIVNTIGALIMSWGAFQYMIGGKKSGPLSRFIGWAVDEFIQLNPKISSGR